MNNVGMANMNAMAAQVGGPMPMAMNNGAMPTAQQMPQQQTQTHRTMLNTYIYDYFVKEGLYDVARAMLSSEQQINVLQKDSPGRRENGLNGAGDDPMDTDSKDDLDKRPSDLPAANIPISSDSCFLYEWFGLFWEMLNGHRLKPGGNTQVSSYIQHTQQQNRLKQSQQQEMLRQMRPDQMQFNPAMMRNMPNGMQMAAANAANKNNLARTAMANNQNNPQAMAMMQQQAKQNQMQRDPSDMDGNRRPASPGSTDNAPSPSKRPRLEGQAPFNPQQAGMMPNGRPQQQGMPGQQVGIGNNPTQLARVQAATKLLLSHDIDPSTLTPEKFQNFANQPPNAQKNSIATYSQNLQQHHGQQMPNKGMANPGPQGQGSPMMQQGPNPADISTLYNANEFGGAMRPGPGNGQGGGSNHALQDYQMQLMLLEQQNKKRLMMARQEQDSMGNIPRGDGPAVPGPGGPQGPPGPNGQAFPDTSPQGARTGASPNPSDQMKRGTPQMNSAGIPSPLPEGAQSRGSPNPMGFMPNPPTMDPTMPGAQQFFKGMNGMEANMVNGPHMNGAMRPPSSHPNQPFNGQVNPQQMMAARQAQGGQGGPNQMQWQGGPNGAMMPQGPQGQVQGTPQPRNAQMPPPSAPGPASGTANGRTQPSSPATSNAAPPTPQQSTKAAPKKKDTKGAKKAAANKKSNANTGATPAAESSQDQEPPTPATPITPANPAANFAKNGQNAGGPPVPNAQTTAPPAPAPVAPQAHPDPSAGFGMDNTAAMNFEIGSLDFANPIDSNNVLQDFDFDSFLHDGDAGGDGFDFTNTFDMQGGEIATE
ncbi:hypothetical protein SUNI508_09273 [Seiridium unicorne]|uniref:LisH domain-containing protein n=1 Tax=Seiridium unicorne TaxID=138068 RepID=A0ABR2UQW9_9PEZI